MSTNNRSKENKESFPIYAGMMAMFLWSTTAIANKIAIYYMDGLSAGILRSLIAGIIAFIIAIALRYPFPRAALDRLLLVISGVSSFAIWPTLVSLGIERTSVGHAALIMALIPIFTVMLGSLVERKAPKLGWWFGASIALFATFVLIFYRHNQYSSFNTGASLAGDLIIFTGGIICSIGYVAGGKLSPKMGAKATTFWGLAIALFTLIPAFYAVSGNTDWTNMAAKGWYSIIWMALISSLAGYALWFFALGQGGVKRIGSILLVMPVITLCLASLVLAEQITFFLIAICAFIVIGTYQAQKHAR